MFLKHFDLREWPFRLSPDPAYLFLSKDHARAKAYMESAVWLNEGFVMITGEIGAGKSTLIQTIISELPKDITCVLVSQTQIKATELLQLVLVELGFSPFRMGKGELLATFNGYLAEQLTKGRRVLLIVDEAQNLAHSVLEEIRLLTTVETTRQKVLRVIFVGQRELNDTMGSIELIQLAQRMRYRFHLGPLGAPDVGDYIQHRLDVAGAGGRKLFHDDTIALIHRSTRGIPRMINSLCDVAMSAAMSAGRYKVEVEDVRTAIRELDWSGAEPGRETVATAEESGGVSAEDSEVRPVYARLLIARDGSPTREVALTAGSLGIGRTADNDLQLDHRGISRHHARITTTSQTSILEDRNSTNGVYVRRKRVRLQALNDGDIIHFGDFEVMYIDERH